MKTLILVGGASASGKSTLVKGLNNSIEKSIAYRRVQAFFDCAEHRGVPKEDVFNEINSTDADDWFLNVCCDNVCVISDIHYALQMDRTFKTDNSDANIYQEYVPTISESLINKLLENRIRVIAIHITCAPVVTYQRAINRNQSGERELRAVSLEDVRLQSTEERNAWLNVCANPCVEYLELNSELCSPNEMVGEVIDYLKKTNPLLKVKKKSEDT